MFLNTLKPATGSRPKSRRLGRGIGSTLGKTSGKGHKGQKARAGGFHKVGFEGGQMPLQRRLPKSGFKSQKRIYCAEICLGELKKVWNGNPITLKVLIDSNIVHAHCRRANVIDSGNIDVPVILSGLHVTKGARLKAESVGGKIED
jgi:large subunit ribosomal protein L15